MTPRNARFTQLLDALTHNPHALLPHVCNDIHTAGASYVWDVDLLSVTPRMRQAIKRHTEHVRLTSRTSLASSLVSPEQARDLLDAFAARWPAVSLLTKENSPT